MAPIIPTTITVRIRVVGIQYQEDVVIPVADPTIKPTIEDLMIAARDSGSDRQFNFESSPQGLHTASAFLPARKQSMSSPQVYPSATYSLTDNVRLFDDITKQYSVTTWQWYVIRKDNPNDPKEIGRQINKPDSRTEAFDKPRNETLPAPQYRFLEDGDEVIWRLVVVAEKATNINATLVSRTDRSTSEEKAAGNTLGTA